MSACVFERHPLEHDEVTYTELTAAQSKAFLTFGELADGTVSVMAVAHDKHGDLAYAIERCSDGSRDKDELLEADKRAAGRKLCCS